MLTGSNKKEYQREYMRKRRSNNGSNKKPVIPVKAVQPNSNLTDTYSAPMPAWMKPGAKVTLVKPACPAWLS